MKHVLKEVFGFDHLKPGQAEVVDALLAGRSALAVFPTGGGKSLCYQLPALLLEGMALVVSPLLALMKDQVDGLVAKGIPAARLDSSLETDEALQVMRRVQSGDLRLLYISPEKFVSDEFRKLLKGIHISLLAVDEAHCISEWGHSFRPDYLKVANIRRKLRIRCVLALTATATTKVQADIRRSFGIGVSDVVKLSFHRRNLDLKVIPCSIQSKKTLLLDILNDQDKAAIVYVTRQETAEEVATYLASKGLKAKAYHAGLKSEVRREIQESFMAGDVHTVVATIAFGMGVDKSDIRTVIHYNLPKSVEGYTQEIGRAGRDGQAASCVMLACADDRTVLENFIYSDTPSKRAVHHLLDRVLCLGDEFDLSIYHLAITCDIRQTVIETILTYLELDGVLESGKKFFDTYRAKLLRPLATILAGRSAREKKLLKSAFVNLDEEWQWFVVVSEDERIRPLMDEMELAGEIVLKRTGWRQAYRLKKQVSRKEYAEAMVTRFQEKERWELERLEQVFALASTNTCITAKMLRHFGEKMVGNCGHCDRCRGIKPVRIQRSKPRKVSDAELLRVKELVAENHPSLGTSRQLARFLCGMSSPACMAARLYRHDSYGLFADLPFLEVEILAESWF